MNENSKKSSNKLIITLILVIVVLILLIILLPIILIFCGIGGLIGVGQSLESTFETVDEGMMDRRNYHQHLFIDEFDDD